MRQVTQIEFKVNMEEFEKKLQNEECLFIYPTDTIYGLGCDATNEKADAKLRKEKDRHKRPISVIAPSKEWIMMNCEVTDEAKKYLDKLPGPYTLILKLKNKQAISPLTNMDEETIGVRIPNNWFAKSVAAMGFPVVTTSANKMGEEFMTSLDNLAGDIKGYVDFIIYEGEKVGSPSTIINLATDSVEIKER